MTAVPGPAFSWPAGPWAVAPGAAHCPSCDTGWQPTPLATAGRARSVTCVNSNHAKLCGSPEWAAYLHDDVLPRVTAGIDLGADMLEIGPGPGAATGRLARLTALEPDEAAATALAAKFPGVMVAVGDATRMSYPDGSFDSVGSFTMLHHVPTTAQQNQLLAEVLRVLRPGGYLVGSDSLPGNDLHHFHADDVC